MTRAAPQDPIVLILTDQAIEAADIADFATSKQLGQIVVERDPKRALSLVKTVKARVKHAFIGMPSAVNLSDLFHRLACHGARVVVIDGKPALRAECGSVTHVARPFVDTDLEDAIACDGAA